jgi:hypothetical protein
MKNWNIEKTIGVVLLIFSVVFNLYLYRLEPTATIDPNDNTFQFGLVDRTNTVWDFAASKCSSNIVGILTFPLCHSSFLIDHWVHNWAVGFNLPYYYSHIPQILIVASWRATSWVLSVFSVQYSLFTYYHLVIYLLLCFFPVSMFLALRVIGLSWMTAGIGALLATNLSTDGLYGLDPSSFLWRGYGLSSQLFAMIWLPFALAYSYRYFADKEAVRSKQIVVNNRKFTLPLPANYLLLATLFTAATTAGHLGIGMITMLSLGFLAVSAPVFKLFLQEPLRNILDSAKNQIIRLSLVAGIAIFLLSYWIVPTFIHGNYHNISFWDPVWKFDSYGWKETMIRLFNGDLFDFGRPPVITLLTLLGAFVCLIRKPNNNALNTESGILNHDKAKNIQHSVFSIHNSLFPFSFLFIFWILFYFGRTTWGGLIDIIPGMKDFHLSRFLVGVHIAGMFLAPVGFVWLAEWVTGFGLRVMKILKIRLPRPSEALREGGFIRLFVYSLIGLLLIPSVYKWTLTYNELNDRLIVQANANHTLARADEQKLFTALKALPPARTFTGRGGGFGKDFRVAETPWYMHLSTYGIPTTLWLPETWSMNSDTEQYFSEDQVKDYDLYNMRWVVAPPGQPAQPFWQFRDESATWKLYEVATSGYFTTGVRAAIISITKLNFVNLVHLWIQSDAHAKGIFPELTFDTRYPKTSGLPNFKMTDEVTYITPDKKTHNIWTEPPVYFPPGVASQEQLNNITIQQYNTMKLTGPEKNENDMIYSTRVEVGNNCIECMVILKQTFHPGWRATVNGKSVKPVMVFPFYPAVLVDSPGTYDVVFSYTPSPAKVFLFVLGAVTLVLLFISYVAVRRIPKTL